MDVSFHDGDVVARFAESVLRLSEAKLNDEYFYQHLPLCVIDAVFSINVRYVSVQNVIDRYCRAFSLRKYRSPHDGLPLLSDQEPISAFCIKIEKKGIPDFAAQIFQNRCRTSTRSGILKAEAAFRFASVLRKHTVEYLQEVKKCLLERSIEREILTIPGQSSGTSFRYFLMLCGSEDFIKPDRMIHRFLFRALRRKVNNTEAHELLTYAVEQLSPRYPALTPRILDNCIWKWQRDQ